MNARSRAVRVIARRQLFEVLISPGYYIALAAGMLVGYAVVRGFIGSIDSSGFNPALNPLFDLISRSLAGAFGQTFVDTVFAGGPFLFASLVSFLPVFLFVAAHSVLTFGIEKNAGAVELLTYGPSDGTSYILASLVRDFVLTLAALLVLLGFMALAAVVNNLAFGAAEIFSTLVVFSASLAIFSYGLLASVAAGSATSALALFIAVLVVFLAVFTGSFAITTTYVRDLSTVVAWVIKWVSPFFYASLSFQGLSGGSPLAMGAGIALLLVLSGLLVLASHLVVTIRGVRA